MPTASEAHFRAVIGAIMEGRLTPFLGAGVNLVGRPEQEHFRPGGGWLPSGSELASYLAGTAGFEQRDALDLARVSQWIEVMDGSGPLYQKLHAIFDGNFPITELHQLLAELPGMLRERGLLPRPGFAPYPLIVTTNYDDVLERAFDERGEPYDLVWYATCGEQPGLFVHRTPDGETHRISVPNEYRDVALTERCAILKIHGAVSRSGPAVDDHVAPDDEAVNDSYVITEDDYITFLAHADISGLLPVTLAGKLRRSNFLFLGYGLRDWNLRVILHRIWTEHVKTGTYSSWAIQLNPEELDQKFWQKRNVEVIDMRLERYLALLRDRLCALGSAEVA
ncbi:MAG TPA: SIR2 family protein [Candidatus Eisenbacteria bacterium]|nr:SIR2 family protein [Candidatus Eisenbacteria bacterium]